MKIVLYLLFVSYVPIAIGLIFKKIVCFKFAPQRKNLIPNFTTIFATGSDRCIIWNSALNIESDVRITTGR